MIATLLWLVFTARSGHGSDIIGGEVAAPHSLRFMALVVSQQHLCGGTLINSQWVLTAAHCSWPANLEKVIVGVSSVRSKQTRRVLRLVKHPRYDAKTNDYDLMLLQLDRPVKPTQAVQWVRLDRSGKPPSAGTKCVVAGWGLLDYAAKNHSDVLRWASVTVMDRQTCTSADYYQPHQIKDGMICAGGASGDSGDPCTGDSGGPLLCLGAQVAVTSFGIKGCPRHMPNVYAHLSAQRLQWIRDTTGT